MPRSKEFFADLYYEFFYNDPRSPQWESLLKAAENYFEEKALTRKKEEEESSRKWREKWDKMTDEEKMDAIPF